MLLMSGLLFLGVIGLGITAKMNMNKADKLGKEEVQKAKLERDRQLAEQNAEMSARLKRVREERNRPENVERRLQKAAQKLARVEYEKRRAREMQALEKEMYEKLKNK